MMRSPVAQGEQPGRQVSMAAPNSTRSLFTILRLAILIASLSQLPLLGQEPGKDESKQLQPQSVETATDGGAGARGDTSPVPEAERWNLYYQATSIGQRHGTFDSP